MNLLKKLKQKWIWSTRYKAVFVTVEKTYTLEHRIGRAPKMTMSKNTDTLRGHKIGVIIFDEVVAMENLDNFELPKTNVVYQKENRL